MVFEFVYKDNKTNKIKEWHASPKNITNKAFDKREYPKNKVHKTLP